MHVTLVSGPPGAGKSTWIREHRTPGAVVVDFDALAVALGSPVDPATRDRSVDARDQHPPLVYAAAGEARSHLLRVLLRPDAPDGRLFVVATAPHPALRHRADEHVRLGPREPVL